MSRVSRTQSQVASSAEAHRVSGLVGEASPTSISTDADEYGMANLRVLVVHDWIVAWGGAERTVEQILRIFPRADLLVGVIGKGSKDLNAVTRVARETWLSHVPFSRTHHRWFLPAYPAAFASVNTKGYDLILSSSSAFAKSVRARAGVPHLCYCHTPPRYLWDLQSEYWGDGSMAGRALRYAGPALRALDRVAASGVTRFIANSHFVADRIRRAYGRTATVIYPPVSPKAGAEPAARRTGSFLSLGRLVPYKRVDLVIRAANAAGKPLIVAGDGPERARLESIAGPTVTFLGEVSEGVAGQLMESCGAMVFCAEEDFGIAPVEANAHGLPVVAFGRGGATETLVDGVTGTFFAGTSPECIGEAMQRAEDLFWDESVIRANATRFSPERFRRDLSAVVRSLF